MDGRSLVAALLICLCFGSIHAYGVLLVPIEHWLGTSRTVASLGYAIAVAALTVGVYFNGCLDPLLSPATRLLGCGAVAALGLLLAAGSSSAVGLLAGFGVMYGLANGIAYALSLGLAATAMPGREAQAMGLATAAYGLGAVLCAQAFDTALSSIQVAVILLVMAPVVFAACLVAAVLAKAPRRDVRSAATAGPSTSRPLFFLWLGYLLGAFSGLMVLAHAPSIATWREGVTTQAGLVSGLVSLGSVAGGYLGGVIAARMPGRRGFAIPVLVQAATLASLTVVSGLAPLATIFGVAGLCYGVLIAVVPAEVRRLAGPQGFAASYGKVFSAWGIAGVAGPVTAGYLFDMTSGYGAALISAALLSLLSCIVVMRAIGQSRV